jgi:hypothetical protein
MFETVALPANLQPQSTLVNLPAEIKHQIFKACLTFDDVISDPTVSGGTQRRAVQSLNVAILQTCRRLYHEIDRRKCVEAPDNDKIIRWGRKDGRLSLEVVSKNHLLRHVDRAWHSPSVRSQGEGCWPENGSCLWSDYEKKDLKVMDMSRKD